MTEDAPQRTYSLRDVFNGVRWIARAGTPWRMMPNDLPPQDRTQVEQLTAQVQEVTGEAIEVAFVDQGYTGDQLAQDAAAHGIHLEAAKLPEAKNGFMLLPRRWVVKRSFAWAARFRRLARDYERLPATLAGFHVLAFAILLLTRLVVLMVQSA
jgi:transposase